MKTNRKNIFSNLYRNRELLFALVKREYSARYKQSILGPAWAILQPFVLMVLFTIIRSFISIPSDGIPYPIFAYSALLPWTFFSNSISFASASIVQNAGILRKIYFPRELFPIAAALTSSIDFGLSFIIYIGMMIWYRISVSIWILLLPALLLTQLMLALGFALVFSAIGAFRRDVIFGTPLLMQFWMFLCPIMYPLSSVPEKYRAFYLLNPMAGLVDAYRTILVKQGAPELQPILFGLVGSIAVFLIGYWFFKSLEMRFADVV